MILQFIFSILHEKSYTTKNFSRFKYQDYGSLRSEIMPNMDILTTILTGFLVFTLLFYNYSTGNILAYKYTNINLKSGGHLIIYERTISYSKR